MVYQVPTLCRSHPGATKRKETKYLLQRGSQSKGRVQDRKWLQMLFCASRGEVEPNSLHVNLGYRLWFHWSIECSQGDRWACEAKTKEALPFPPSAFGMAVVGKPAAMERSPVSCDCHAGAASGEPSAPACPGNTIPTKVWHRWAKPSKTLSTSQPTCRLRVTQ